MIGLPSAAHAQDSEGKTEGLAEDSAEESAGDPGAHPVELEVDRVSETSTGGSFLIRGVTIHTALEPAFVGDVLVEGGKIVAVGEVDAADGVFEIEGEGRHLAPGVVDCHSHMAIERGINEGTESITAEVDISDSLNNDDLTIFRALAGGVTTARLLHGSANAIGGRHEVIKLKWGRTSPDELRFSGAPEGVKFALGENPKRSNSGRRGERFPATRMGVEAIFYRAFERAREYSAEWQVYSEGVAGGNDLQAPRRDIRLDALVGIMDGSVEVHSHCYRADEILMLLRAAEHFGFRIKTLQHVLEGYKVAHEIAEHGAGPSTFSDWWAYKIEAYDAIPTNAALLEQAGCVASINSDSGEVVRHLYAEAAKSVRYAGMDRVQALRLVTLNPALQLGIADRIGSIEVGKDADLALLDGDPLSAYSKVRMTFVDGEVEFERRDAFGLEDQPAPVRELQVAGAAGTDEGSPSNDANDANGSQAQGEMLALVGATLHPMDADVIPGGTLLVRAGRIEALGVGLDIPAEARVVDLQGKHVWPGVIALDTGLGLFEIGAVAATQDVSEGGGNQPDVRAAASLNADSAHLAVTRYNGVTRAQSAPQGGGPLRGQSCVIGLTGQTWEELLLVDRDMLHVDFPGRANDAKDREEPSERQRELAREFEAARDYAELARAAEELGSAVPVYDPRLEALAPFATGTGRVALHVSSAQSILDALRFVREQQLDAVLYDVREGWKVAQAIADSGLACVVGPVLAVPRSRFEPYDAPYSNAAVLARAGVPLAISAAGDENPRNVLFHAAMASAFGLPQLEAQRSITLYAAQLLGLEGQLGSLTPGKRADLVVTDGDLLELTTAVLQVFIDGQVQPMENRQTRLHARYAERLGRLQAR